MRFPTELKYTKDHEWVRLEGKTATIGITDHAQSALGDIVYVDLPKVGSHVDKGRTFGSVESVKAVSDIYSPVTGEVTLTLYKGNLRVSSRTSPYSLYDDAIASMEAGGSYNQTDAEGFLRIMGLPSRVQGRVRPRQF